MKTSLIIPLPPGTEGQAASGLSKAAVGLYPCLNDGDCIEYFVVKIDSNGCPYGNCSKRERLGGACGRKGPVGLPKDAPIQTYEEYQKQLAIVLEGFPMPPVYKLYLEREWQVYNEREAEHDRRIETPEQ